MGDSARDNFRAMMAQLKEAGISAKPGALAQAITATELELARRDPADFAAFAFVDNEGRPWDLQPFHRDWQNLIPRYGTGGKTLIVSPHESAKTSQLSVARILWEIGKNPNVRIRILCSDDTLAEAIIFELGQHILSNERLHLVFPRLEPSSPWTTSKLTVKRTLILKDPTIQAESIMGGGTGGRVDYLMVDDVCTLRNTLSQPKFIPVVKAAFYNVFLNMISTSPPGRIVVAGTPWAENDLIGDLRKNSEWAKWERPVIDADGKNLWPKKYTRTFLRQKERDLGPRYFQRGFYLKAITEGEKTFGDKCIFADPALRWGTRVPPEWIVLGGLDPATAGQATFLTAALDPVTHKRIPLELLRFEDQDSTELALAVVRSYLRWHHQLLVVENNSTQESFQALIRAVALLIPDKPPPLPLEGLYTGSQKWDPRIGLPSLAAKMRQGIWPIPYACQGCGEDPCLCHGDGCDCESCEWIKELQLHPQYRSDVIMAQWLIEQKLTELEFDSSGEAGDEVFQEVKESLLNEQF